MIVILKDPDREIRGRTGEQGGSESSGPGLCQPSTQQRSTLMPGQQHELTRLETRDQAEARRSISGFQSHQSSICLSSGFVPKQTEATIRHRKLKGTAEAH